LEDIREFPYPFILCFIGSGKEINIESKNKLSPTKAISNAGKVLKLNIMNKIKQHSGFENEML